MSASDCVKTIHRHLEIVPMNCLVLETFRNHVYIFFPHRKTAEIMISKLFPLADRDALSLAHHKRIFLERPEYCCLRFALVVKHVGAGGAVVVTLI